MDEDREIRGMQKWCIDQMIGEFDAEKLDFEVNGRKNKLSGLLILQKGEISFLNHFINWIRDVLLQAVDNDGTVLLKENLGDVTVDNNEDYLLIDLTDDANNQL
ncbi:hypothetical protein TNCV_1909261 [Trichonephila clavipes]|nr:hypothetical protein TNCV_1909261 [Trichonephila clavipes]